MDNLARRQITIPARVQGESIQLRVAAYCRVSTDSADQKNSFAAQNADVVRPLWNPKGNHSGLFLFLRESVSPTCACSDKLLCLGSIETGQKK